MFAILLITSNLSLFAQNNPPGQYQVTGKIINHTDKKPVAGASVFLGNATIGNETDNDGAFTLQNVKPGKYMLVVSIVGFDILSEPLTVTNINVSLPDIEISPSVITLGEVKIKANAGKDAYSDWAHETFLKEFLGTSDYAKDCKILNPEVLNVAYDQSTNTITASSSDFLLIENDALGYNIKYRLTKFEMRSNSQEDKDIHYEGSVFFKEMKGSPGQEKRWKQNRQELYGNSSTHFLRAILNDQLDEEGFRVLRVATIANPNRSPESLIQANINRLKNKQPAIPDSLRYWKKVMKLPVTIQMLMPTPLTKADLVSNADQPGVFKFGDNNDELIVMYNKERRFTNAKQLADLNNLNYIVNKAGNKEYTLLNFTEPYTLFDNNGGIFNPNSLVFKGAWIANRVGDLLPIDYEEKPGNSGGEAFKNDALLKNIVTATNSYNTAKPVEKVYLHLDRSYYTPGDTIWFKAYTVLGGLHQLSDISGVLYAELINNNDLVVSRRTIRLVSGIGIGDFDLPILLKPGNYRVRAYTNYMRNAGTDYYYDQNIEIGGEKKAQLAVAQNAQAKPDVQFFPEGGELVNGLDSKVAVKSVNVNGLGENITGEIIDDAGNKIAGFSTTHLGMGMFELTPQAGKKYRANITCANGATFKVDMPQAREKGFELAIDNNKTDSIYIKVAANDKLFKENKDAVFYLLAQSGGKVYYTTAAKMATREFTTQIAKKRFPSGIAQFTLLSQTGEPLNERVIFIRNDDTLKLTLSSSSRIYAPRQKVTVNMGINTTGLPAPGSFSVSVINESRVPVNENAETTILNSLLLTSDLKGYIEQPNYYFISNNAKTAADLDLLMLTQGYRRFEWKRVVDTAHSTLAYQPQTSLSLSGSVKTPSGKPVPNARVTFIASRQNFFTDTTANAKGDFTFNNLALPDSAIIVLRGNKQNNNGNVNIAITPADIPVVMKNKVNLDTSRIVTPVMMAGMEDHDARLKQSSLKNGIQLKEVKVKSSVIHKPDLKYSANLNGAGNADQVIMSDQLMGCIDLATCLDGKVFGVRFRNGNAYNNRAAQRFGKQGGNGAQDAPPLTVIIDGLITHENLNTVNTLDIYSIEVLRSGAYLAIYGSEASTGALVITTKRGNEPMKLADPTAAGLITYPFKGYSLARMFYSPKYDVPQTELKTTDSRSTIYWDPEVITDKDGKASFDYYNADTKGIYRVVVEGIDGDGNIGRQVYRYKVE